MEYGKPISAIEIDGKLHKIDYDKLYEPVGKKSSSGEIFGDY